MAGAEGAHGNRPQQVALQQQKKQETDATPIPLQCHSNALYDTAGIMKDLFYQDIIGYSGDQISKWYAAANFLEKPGRVHFALRLVVDYCALSPCLTRGPTVLLAFQTVSQLEIPTPTDPKNQ